METNKYCIIKVMKLSNGKEINVIMLDGGSEILEFDSKGEADEMADMMELNSDSGWKYIIKEI